MSEMFRLVRRHTAHAVHWQHSKDGPHINYHERASENSQGEGGSQGEHINDVITEAEECRQANPALCSQACPLTHTESSSVVSISSAP